MLDTLLVLVVTVHLLAVNVATAGPFVCMWLAWRRSTTQGQTDDESTHLRVERFLTKQSFLGLVGASLLGAVALYILWLMQPTAYLRAAQAIPSRRYWFGLVEVGFSLGCLAWCLALLKREVRSSKGRTRWRIALNLFTGTNLLYHFPALFAIAGVLSTRPLREGTTIHFQRWMLDAEVLARTLHFLLASFAITGVLLIWLACRLARQGHPEANARRIAVWGARVSLVPTLLQLASGVWVLVAMPAANRDLLLGEDWLGTLLFALSLFATLALVHRLVAVALGAFHDRELVGCVVLTLLVVTLMAGVRHRARFQALRHADASKIKSCHGFETRLTPHGNQRDASATAWSRFGNPATRQRGPQS